MNIVSIVNMVGDNNFRTNNEDTRIVGFKVTVPSIEENHEMCKVVSPDLIEELSIQYLESKGYKLQKAS